MTSFLRNKISKLYNTVSAPVAATLAERWQSVRETISLLYKRMMENMGFRGERLKEIVEKEVEEQQQEEEEDVDLIPHEHERALKGAYSQHIHGKNFQDYPEW